MISFRILQESKKSRARLGLLKTPHGEVQTPTLVPVATQATVKAMTADQVLATGTQLLICNTYHLHLRPGEGIVKKHGGLHAFMHWPRPLMTDSGGFQVFSLGFGMDRGTTKILKEDKRPIIKPGSQPKLVRIDERGVTFRSYIDGKKLYLDPKSSMRIQAALGADIAFAFDECPPPQATRAYHEESLRRTHRWAELSLNEHSKKQALYGIVQGGKYQDLRQKSALFIGKLGFEGFGIGGEFGASKPEMIRMIRWVTDTLPEEKPRHLLGIGYPEDIPKIIRAGVDTFDCIVPTHYARRGIAFVAKGRLDLKRRSCLNDHRPIDAACACPTCKNYSRAYLTHLLRAHEITPLTLITFHNLFWFNAYVARIREGIRRGTV
ncbi:tRNA guanosine(34) transglycosylase Tgt [Candidatus Parcubacteria bacterium]|nr:MAG: tRNA guanosine(34) transglycosylase Tgt [Candidatus Parcubacteria bacterium]